ncbi:putative cobyrinic acid a,c-diamide synthase [Lactiplantibacillus plantarum]|nr:putative cobyrinic acid a,c-diamide synthase [Lactiplantibacillus plantarum]MCG0700475.1 putative cobyrinic acid a,c-diamide synthase [Lactiplantibacillus plantarum]MCG0703646.1 putative cobyrinic acid a,c-diamide synthase [Lactiplantibacillus plantarum]MCG0706435.1 putative cobyrinic acid a,c-diamide synthase [Lactiplantibacillus plantarum]MCG0709482.1 putative cobyrinic acid a,c-diamide synthase [Lactiplantibacillus plantarum]
MYLLLFKQAFMVAKLSTYLHVLLYFSLHIFLYICIFIYM